MSGRSIAKKTGLTTDGSWPTTEDYMSMKLVVFFGQLQAVCEKITSFMCLHKERSPGAVLLYYLFWRTAVSQDIGNFMNTERAVCFWFKTFDLWKTICKRMPPGSPLALYLPVLL